MNARLGRCFSPLGAALGCRHFDIAELLYQHGADVGIRGNQKWTLLHASSRAGFVGSVRWLLDHWVGAQTRQDNHKAPIHLAEASGHLGQCKIIDPANDTNDTPLHLASLHGHFEIVRQLIEHGAEVNSLGEKHRTPLHLASSLVSTEIVTLDPARADVYGRGKRPSSNSLFFGECVDLVQVLIEHGADLIAQDDTGSTPLHLVSSKGSARTVRVLIKHGAGVSARNGNHEIPLHLASSSGSTETVRLFLRRGVEVNAQDWSHKMPLHLASSLVCAKCDS